MKPLLSDGTGKEPPVLLGVPWPLMLGSYGIKTTGHWELCAVCNTASGVKKEGARKKQWKQGAEQSS